MARVVLLFFSYLTICVKMKTVARLVFVKTEGLSTGGRIHVCIA